MTKTKLDIRFTVRIKNKSYTNDYEGFTAKVQYMSDEIRSGSDSGLRNPCSWDDDNLASLADLGITAQRDRGSEVLANWYGYQLDYREAYSVDLRRAKLMVKTLSAVERRTDKLNEQLGYVTDLGDFCARCAIALGVTSAYPFGIWSDATTFDGTHYRWVDVNGLRDFLAPAKADAAT